MGNAISTDTVPSTKLGRIVPCGPRQLLQAESMPTTPCADPCKGWRGWFTKGDFGLMSDYMHDMYVLFLLDRSNQ